MSLDGRTALPNGASQWISGPPSRDWVHRLRSGMDAGVVGAGTVPYFGYKFRVFPFARMMPQLMNLRITTLGAFSTLMHLPKIWRGVRFLFARIRRAFGGGPEPQPPSGVTLKRLPAHKGAQMQGGA